MAKKTKYELTPEHRAHLAPWADRWTKIIMSTEPMSESDREAARTAVLGLYSAAKLAPPKRIVFVPSPAALAFAGGFSAGLLALRAETPAATYDATYAATRDATDTAVHGAAYDATHGATDGATRAATYAATYVATGAATNGATSAATLDATHGATSAATRAATRAATYDVTYVATGAATNGATLDATRAATYDATYVATGAATDGATSAATLDATYAATHGATSAATRAATRAATYAATDTAVRAATSAATYDATYDATYAATDGATSAATLDATYVATDTAVRAATSAATYDATYAATRDATDTAVHGATYDATHGATDGATRAATYRAMSGFESSRNWYSDISAGMADMAARLAGTRAAFLLTCASQSYSMWNGGNQWAQSPSAISFFRHVAKLPIDYTAWSHYETLAEVSGPRIMHAEFCMISDRPEILSVDDQNLPHNDTGPFCRWRDGFSLYAVHGVRVPQWLIEHPEMLTVEKIHEETNSEVRRVMVERYGMSRYVRDAQFQVLDNDLDPLGQSRRLLRRGDLVVVELTNSTVDADGTRRVYHVPCHPELRPMLDDGELGEPQTLTALNAVASTYGMRGDEYVLDCES